MDIPLPGEPEPVFLIPTPDSPPASKTALHHSNEFAVSLSSRTDAFFSDIPMPDEKPEHNNRLSRESPTRPILEDDPPQGSSPTSNHTNRFLVLGKVQAKKRLLAFSATKQAGGAGLTFNLPKKTVVKPNLAKGFEQLTEDGDITPDTPLVKKKAAGKKGAPKEDKAKAVVSAIEEIKREELLLRGAFRMAAQSGGSAETADGASTQRQVDRKREGDMYTMVDDLLAKENDKDANKKKSRSRKHRGSSDKKSERHSGDKEKDRNKAKDKEQKSKEKTKSKPELCKLPVSWAEFRSQKMDFDQIRRAKRELPKKKSRHTSRSKDAPILLEQFEKELCNPLDFPARRKEPFKAVGARQREKLYPLDTVRYTKYSPTISFSANPDIPSSRYRSRSEIFSFATPAAISIMSSIIEAENPEDPPSLVETDSTSLKRRKWHVSSEFFMKPGDSDGSEICDQSLLKVIELQPSSVLDESEKKQSDLEKRDCEMDSDPTIPDVASSKWDSEFEDDSKELHAAESKSLTTIIVPDSDLVVQADNLLNVSKNDDLSPVKNIQEEDEEMAFTNGLPDTGVDVAELPSQSAAVGVSGDPYLANEYEEFMKSVCVHSEEASLGTSLAGSESIVDDSKKRKRHRDDSQEKSKPFPQQEVSSKKSTVTRKDKNKKRSKVSKKVRKDSSSSSPVSSDEEEDEKPRVKRRKLKTKKTKVKSWKKNKKRKRRVSSSSSDEMSSSSETSDSSLSDSSLGSSSTSEDRIFKKRSKKGAKKKKKIAKKSKQKRTKSSKKKKREKTPKAASNESIPVTNEKRLTHSKGLMDKNTVKDESLGKVFSTEACCWVDMEETGKDPVMAIGTVTSLDLDKQSMADLKRESDDSEEFGDLLKMRLDQCEVEPPSIRKDVTTPLASDGCVNAEIRKSPETIKEILPNESDQTLFRCSEKYEIDSLEDGDSLETAFANDVSQAGESCSDSVKAAKSNFSRLDVITAEAWENDSQERLDNENKRLKYGGEWEESTVNWFIKSMPEETVKSPVDLMPPARMDIQNTSSLSDDLHQEVGKRSLRELKYLRDVIKNEVVDEGATLESPPVKPIIVAGSENFIEKMSLSKTSMVTSFVKDFSERTDFRPVTPPTLENLPLASDLYSPGQEDDKSTRSNSPEELVHDSYKITPEESKSDMSLDSPDLSNDSDKCAEKNIFFKMQKRNSELIDGQFISLGSIPLPPKCDLLAIEVPGEPAPCLPPVYGVQAIEVPEERAPCLLPTFDLQSIEVPEAPATCLPTSVEIAPATVIGKCRAKETQESSSLAKTKHVITVKLLPSELRFKNTESKPVEVVSAAVNEILPRNDGKTVWKAIGGPKETAVPSTSIVKKPSRWNSVPCAVIVNENFSPAEELSSLKLSPHERDTIDAEVSVDPTYIEATFAAVCSPADESTVTNGSTAVANEVSSSIIGSGLNTNVIDTKEEVLTHSSGEIGLLKNYAPPEINESMQVKAKEHGERSDREKDLSKKSETRDRDSRRPGSRSRDDSKKRDNREKDTKRKEERAKEDSRKGDRGDSRNRDRHKADSRRDRRDVKRSRDDKRRSPERNDSRHSEKHRTSRDEPRSPGARRSSERSDRRRRSRSRENSRSHRLSSRKRSPNHDRVRSSENKDESRSSSHKSGKDSDKRRSERSGYNANGDSLVNIPLPDIQHHGKDDCCSMDMECCSPVSNFSPLVGLKRSVADSTTISDEELKLANCEQKSSIEDYSKTSYSYESPMRSSAGGNASATGDSEFSPKRLSLDERLELELGLRVSPRQQQEQAPPPDGAQYQCYWPNQAAAPDALIRPPLHAPLGPQANQFVGGPSNFYGQPQQQRLHNFMGAMNSPLMPTNQENTYPPNIRWDHVQPYPGMGGVPDRPPVQPLQQVIVPEKQFIASVPMDNYMNGPPVPTELVHRPLPGARPLSPRILPASIPKVVLIPPMMAPMTVHAQAVQALVPTQDFVRQPNSIAESEVHVMHKFYPEESIYADIPSDTEADEKIIEMLSKAKKRSLGRKAAHKQKEIIRKREILQARELKKKKLAKYKKAILHEGDTLRRSVPLDLEEMRLNTGMQLSPRPGTSSSDIAAFSPVGNFAPLPLASKGILISIGFGVGNEVPLKERRKSVMFADGVRPGEGTSPSAGEDPLSPTLYVPKEKKLRKKKKKIKVHVIRQLASEESSSDSEAVQPPPPPPGSPPPELKPYSFPGPSPGKMILRLSKRIALGGSRVPRVVLLDPASLTSASAPSAALPEAFERTCSDEKTLKLIAYHQAMIAIKGQGPFWPGSVICQPMGTVLESKPQLPHLTNIVMKAITTGPVDLFDQGNGNGVPGPSYLPNANLASKGLSSIPGAPGSQFLDPMSNCAAPLHGMPGERVSTASPILPQGFGFPVLHGLPPPLPQSPQLRNPPPPPPPLPVSKTIATAGNPKV